MNQHLVAQYVTDHLFIYWPVCSALCVCPSSFCIIYFFLRHAFIKACFV